MHLNMSANLPHLQASQHSHVANDDEQRTLKNLQSMSRYRSAKRDDYFWPILNEHHFFEAAGTEVKIGLSQKPNHLKLI